MSKLLFIQTLGCAMNVRDSEHIIAQLKEQDYEITDNISIADLILINTCSVREKPVHKLFSEVGGFEKEALKSAFAAAPQAIWAERFLNARHL